MKVVKNKDYKFKGEKILNGTWALDLSLYSDVGAASLEDPIITTLN